MRKGVDQPLDEAMVPPVNVAKRLLKVRQDFRKSEKRLNEAKMELALAEEGHRLSSLLLGVRERKAAEQLEIEIDNSIYEIVAHLAIYGQNETPA